MSKMTAPPEIPFPDAVAPRPAPQQPDWPDPVSRHMLDCHDGARRLAGELRRRDVWLSHEALLLDFELPQVRAGRDGPFLGSAHWPWLGYR